MAKTTLLSEKIASRLKSAQEMARRKRKLIWLHLYAPWSELCETWRVGVLNDRQVQKLKEEFVFIEMKRDDDPDFDAASQSLMQNLAGQSGWPLNLFLAADLEPVFGATSLNVESFIALLSDLQVAFELSRREMLSAAVESGRRVKESDPLRVPALEIESQSSENISDAAFSILLTPLLQSLDFSTGLMGSSPYFLHPSVYSYLSMVHAHSPSRSEMGANWGEVALTRLAQSTLYDLIGGGFFRSSSSNEPQTSVEMSTEKLLIENAEMLESILEVYSQTKAPFLAQLAGETLRCLCEDFFQEGEFHSWIQASDNYHFQTADLLEALPGNERQPAQLFFGIEGQALIPKFRVNLELLSNRLSMETADLRLLLSSAQQKLRLHRKNRLQKTQKTQKTQLGEAMPESTWTALRVLIKVQRKIPSAIDPKTFEPFLGFFSDFMADPSEAPKRSSSHRENIVKARAFFARALSEGVNAELFFQVGSELLGDMDLGFEELKLNDILGRRYAYADSGGVMSLGGLWLLAWIEKIEVLARLDGAEAKLRLLQLRAKVNHAVTYARRLGLSGASIFRGLGRYLRLCEDVERQKADLSSSSLNI